MLLEYTKRDALWFAHMLESWGALQPALVSLYDENNLAKMLKYELDNQAREIMVSRIKTRFNRVRNDRETKEIKEYAEATLK